MQEFWKNPIIGDNYANVVARMQDMVQGEGMVDFVNTYLYFALFAGAVGLVIFCVSFLVPMARLVTIRRALPPGSAEREVAGFCLAVLMSAAVMIVFTSYLKRPSIFWLASASLAMMIVVPRRAVAGKTTIRVSGQPAAA
jgi:O-antigen ligase